LFHTVSEQFFSRSAAYNFMSLIHYLYCCLSEKHAFKDLYLFKNVSQGCVQHETSCIYTYVFVHFPWKCLTFLRSSLGHDYLWAHAKRYFLNAGVSFAFSKGQQDLNPNPERCLLVIMLLIWAPVLLSITVKSVVPPRFSETNFFHRQTDTNSVLSKCGFS
jgi:hypothetical protein